MECPEFCKSLVQQHLIQDINDYALFGELLRLLNVSEEIVNYFIKPITTIQSTEALAFRNSIYAEFIKDCQMPVLLLLSFHSGAKQRILHTLTNEQKCISI